MMVDNYILINLIGKGTFGEVYLTQKKGENKLFATKRVSIEKINSKDIKKYVINEINILRNIKHKNLIRLEAVMSTIHNYYIITEYCNGGTLTKCLKQYQKLNNQSFNEEIVQHLMRQIVEGIKYLHKKRIIHRDIKMDNILVNFDNRYNSKNLNMLEANIKIIDFGCSVYLEESKLKYTTVGSPVNMDPNILRKFTNKNEIIGYDEKADIWSLGTVCYEMLIGHNVFNAQDIGELIEKVENGTYKVTTNLSKEAVSFLNSMLQYDASKRLSAEQLSHHQFLTKNINEFQKINLKQVYNKVDKEGLKINIKKNLSIWSIFNEENEQFLMNIPPYLNDLKPIPEYEEVIDNIIKKDDNRIFTERNNKVKKQNSPKYSKDENNYLKNKGQIEINLGNKIPQKYHSPPPKKNYLKIINSPINNEIHNERRIISGQIIKYLPLGSRMPKTNLDKYNLNSPRKDKNRKVKVKQKDIIKNSPILKKDESNVNIKLKNQQYNEILTKNKIESERHNFNPNWNKKKNIQIKNNEFKRENRDDQIQNQKMTNNFVQYEKCKILSNELDGNGKTPFYFSKKAYNNNINKYNNMGIITPKKEEKIILNHFSPKKIHHNIKEESKINTPIHENSNYKFYKYSKSKKNIMQKKQDNYNFDEDSEELENIIEDRFIQELTVKNVRVKNNYLYDPLNEK